MLFAFKHIRSELNCNESNYMHERQCDVRRNVSFPLFSHNRDRRTHCRTWRALKTRRPKGIIATNERRCLFSSHTSPIVNACKRRCRGSRTEYSCGKFTTFSILDSFSILGARRAIFPSLYLETELVHMFRQSLSATAADERFLFSFQLQPVVVRN